MEIFSSPTAMCAQSYTDCNWLQVTNEKAYLIKMIFRNSSSKLYCVLEGARNIQRTICLRCGLKCPIKPFCRRDAMGSVWKYLMECGVHNPTFLSIIFESNSSGESTRCQNSSFQLSAKLLLQERQGGRTNIRYEVRSLPHDTHYHVAIFVSRSRLVTS